MDDFFHDELIDDDDWPDDIRDKYQRWEILGKGSFGKVWLCKRIGEQIDEFDDDYVAIKNIQIKNDKGQVYAEREISILEELRHPNVIRLIRAAKEHHGVRVVVMQLARGPNLHQLVTRRGALGLPLSRLISRQLIAAVGYLHGRAVIHRDIKPSNCILACTSIPATKDYDWYMDDAIWSSAEDAVDAIEKQNKWKLMLVDFGFARALEQHEITSQTRHLRNSIVFEQGAIPSTITKTTTPADADAVIQEEEEDEDESKSVVEDNNNAETSSSKPTTNDTNNNDGDNDDEQDKDNKDKESGADDDDDEENKDNHDKKEEDDNNSKNGISPEKKEESAKGKTKQQKPQQQPEPEQQGPHIIKGHDGRSIQMHPQPKRDTSNDDVSDDLEALEKMAEKAAINMRHTSFEPTNDTEAAIMGQDTTKMRTRQSGVSMMVQPDPAALAAAGGADGANGTQDQPAPRRSGSGPGGVGGGSANHRQKRVSTARQHVRSMSALGTKAYAAPEIRKKLRHKTEEDFEKENAAMTECVADYGMIVDSYSVGWTLRVAMTGVPPNFTISEYMRQRTSAVMEHEYDKNNNDDTDDEGSSSMCCGCFRAPVTPKVQIRDPSRIPQEATLLITSMTEKNPENRMTVREAQNHPWIRGGGNGGGGEDNNNNNSYVLPQGDIPSDHGDPVVPLKCAAQLSKLTVQYHMQ